MRRIAILLFCLATSAPVWAQTPTVIQQSATMLHACTAQNATAAVNNQVTLTLTPPAGQYVYVCGIDVTSSQNGTSTANTNSQYTSTNLGPAGNTWGWKYSMAATANLAISQAFYFTQALRSTQPGVAVTIVSPAALAQTAFSINAYYYFAP
jgi:hypothetical protein